MSYPEWRAQLFEETFPKTRFDGGSLSWHRTGLLSIEWDGRQYRIDPEVLYSPDTDPTSAVLHWAWANLPLASWEKEHADVWWSDSAQTFRASVLRGAKPYSQSVVVDASFPRFGAPVDAQNFSWGLEGGLLAVRSLREGIPALCPLSHPISLSEVMEGYFEVGDGIVIATPVHDPQYAFIGHRNTVERIGTEDRGVLGIAISQWQDNITKALEGR